MAVDQKSMQGTQSGSSSGSNTSTGYPVDNRTYNLMQALVSKCEAIEAYRKYAKDGGGELFQQLIQQDWNAADQIVKELKGSFK